MSGGAEYMPAPAPPLQVEFPRLSRPRDVLSTPCNSVNDLLAQGIVQSIRRGRPSRTPEQCSPGLTEDRSYRRLGGRYRVVLPPVRRQDPAAGIAPGLGDQAVARGRTPALRPPVLQLTRLLRP